MMLSAAMLELATFPLIAGNKLEHSSAEQRREEAAIARSGRPLPLNMVDRPFRVSNLLPNEV